MIGLGAVWAYLPEKVEKVLGLEETEEQKREVERLRRHVPRITVVDNTEGGDKETER